MVVWTQVQLIDLILGVYVRTYDVFNLFIDFSLHTYSHVICMCMSDMYNMFSQLPDIRTWCILGVCMNACSYVLTCKTNVRI